MTMLAPLDIVRSVARLGGICSLGVAGLSLRVVVSDCSSMLRGCGVLEVCSKSFSVPF